MTPSLRQRGGQAAAQQERGEQAAGAQVEVNVVRSQGRAGAQVEVNSGGGGPLVVRSRGGGGGATRRRRQREAHLAEFGAQLGGLERLGLAELRTQDRVSD